MADIDILTIAEINYFQANLFQWAEDNPRPLPWKGEKNPYYIWLSEIILQQTRVDQGLAYFQRFKAHYPSVDDLANAPADEVMKLWEGLGYYSRARNLHAAAQYVSQELKGEFPTDYKSILALKGVGPYTAAAIASFAYDLPHAVIDGNVYRVLSRFFGIDIPIDTTIGKKAFATLAASLLPATKAAQYNQAIMDFGAIQCKPKSPNCNLCNFENNCIAAQSNTVASFPVKSKKLKRKKRYFHYLLISDAQQVWIEKREGKDIWQGLYQFPLIEKEKTSAAAIIKQQINSVLKDLAISTEEVSLIHQSKQELTHQQINAYFWYIKSVNSLPEHARYIAMNPKNFHNFAFPKTINAFFSEFDYL